MMCVELGQSTAGPVGRAAAVGSRPWRLAGSSSLRLAVRVKWKVHLLFLSILSRTKKYTARQRRGGISSGGALAAPSSVVKLLGKPLSVPL